MTFGSSTRKIIWWALLVTWLSGALSSCDDLAKKQIPKKTQKVVERAHSGLHDTLTMSIDEILENKNHPFRMKKVPRTLWALLGSNTVDTIMHRYNAALIDTLKAKKVIKDGQTLKWVWYDNLAWQTIKIPAVYPWLEKFFDEELAVFLKKHPEADSLVGNEKEVILVTRNPEGKCVLWYYQNGMLQNAHYTSPWVGKPIRERVWVRKNGKKYRVLKKLKRLTPEWVFWTNLNKERWAYWDIQKTNHKSKAHDAPMPYFVPFAKDEYWEGEGNHQGTTNWDKLSHGCNRNPWYGAKEVSDKVDGRKVKYVIYNLYDKEGEEKKDWE